MNKRQRKKRAKKTREFVDGVFARLNDPAWAKMSSSTVAASLAVKWNQQSILTYLFLLPSVKSPFSNWSDANDVIHYVGTYTDEEMRLACVPDAPFMFIEYAPVAQPATCLRCVAYESGHTWER